MDTPAATELSNSRPLMLSVLVEVKATVMPCPEAQALQSILGRVAPVVTDDVTGPWMVRVFAGFTLSSPPAVGNASVTPDVTVVDWVRITAPVEPLSPTVN